MYACNAYTQHKPYLAPDNIILDQLGNTHIYRLTKDKQFVLDQLVYLQAYRYYQVVLR